MNESRGGTIAPDAAPAASGAIRLELDHDAARAARVALRRELRDVSRRHAIRLAHARNRRLPKYEHAGTAALAGIAFHLAATLRALETALASDAPRGERQQRAIELELDAGAAQIAARTLAEAQHRAHLRHRDLLTGRRKRETSELRQQSAAALRAGRLALAVAAVRTALERTPEVDR